MAPRRAGDLRPLPVSPTVSSVKPSHYRPRPFPRPDRRPDMRRRESPRAAAEATRLRFLGRVRSERNDVGYHRVTRSVNETRPLRTEAHGAPPIETFLGLTGRLRSRRRRRSAPNSARLFRQTRRGRRRGGRCQSACKPGSVWRAFAHVAAIRLGRSLPNASRNQPGRLVRKRPELLRAHAAPIRFCSRWGLPCRPRCRVRGGLLPHLFTLTSDASKAVCSLWHFP